MEDIQNTFPKSFQWVKNIEGLPPPQKILLVFLADYFNEKEGYAWPSQDRLARETGFNRSTIIRALKEQGKVICFSEAPHGTLRI